MKPGNHERIPTVSEVVREAAAVADPDGADGAIAALVEIYEDDGIRTVPEDLLGDLMATAEGIDLEGDEGGVEIATATAAWLGHDPARGPATATPPTTSSARPSASPPKAPRPAGPQLARVPRRQALARSSREQPIGAALRSSTERVVHAAKRQCNARRAAAGADRAVSYDLNRSRCCCRRKSTCNSCPCAASCLRTARRRGRGRGRASGPEPPGASR